jgi:hypothetical protein
MNVRDPLVVRFSRFDPREASRRPALLQLLQDCAQPVGRFRMPGSHVMVEIGSMIDEPRLTHMGKPSRVNGET